MDNFVRAYVDEVRASDETGPIMFLRLLDGSDKVLPVYVGPAEAEALVNVLQNKTADRPLTVDLFHNMLGALRHRVARVCVTHLQNNTYHGSIHVTKEGAREDDHGEEYALDARPSDAVNLAVRMAAPIFVSKEVVQQAAKDYPPSHTDPAARAQVLAHASLGKDASKPRRRFDPLVDLRVKLAVAVSQNREAEAMAAREQIAETIGTGHEASLMLAIEQAVLEERYEEAAKLRDQLKLFNPEVL